MGDDLVKRLRDQQTKWMTPLLGNAADCIEALEAEVAKTREEGRRAGLEEAAEAAWIECAPSERGVSEIEMAERATAELAVRAIRALAKTSTPPHDGVE